jgi:hypothetical protein
MTYRDNISTLVRFFDFLTTQYIVPPRSFNLLPASLGSDPISQP